MKREYIKPVVIFESFQIVTSIAAGCGMIPTSQSWDSCGYKDPSNDNVVYATKNTCAHMQLPQDADEEFCYHVPIEANSLFNS